MLRKSQSKSKTDSKSRTHIRLGYACINTNLRESGIFTSRRIGLKKAAISHITVIHDLIKKNISDLMKILIYNEAHGIRFYRLSSEMFPHYGNPKLIVDGNIVPGGFYDLTFIEKKLKKIGDYAKAHNHRITMHPGQFVQLGSPRSGVVQNSIIELQKHASILKMMGLKPINGSVLIIHGGGTYGDKQTTINRWVAVFDNLPIDVKQYIVLENDEFSYGINDIIKICERLKIPMCVDLFHNHVSNDRVDITRKLLKRIFSTWHAHGYTPKLHVSYQQPNAKRGAHSSTITQLPNYLLYIPKLLRTNLDIMLEVKDKQVSVFNIYNKYFHQIYSRTGTDYEIIYDNQLSKKIYGNDHIIKYGIFVLNFIDNKKIDY